MALTRVEVVHHAGSPREHVETAWIDRRQLSYVGSIARPSKRTEADPSAVVDAYPVTLGPHDLWLVDGPWRADLSDPPPPWWWGVVMGAIVALIVIIGTGIVIVHVVAR